jgi:peptidyl-prolyl cis-trans isomerase SurA
MDMINKPNFYRIVWAVALNLFLCIASPVMAENSTPLDQIAAVVNDDVIMMSEAQQRAQILRSSSKEATGLSPQALLKLAVDNLILEHLQLQKAASSGIEIDDVTLNKAIENIARQNNMDLPHFQQALQQEGIDYAGFREQTRRKLMADILRKRQAQDQVKVTEQEITDLIISQKGAGEVSNAALRDKARELLSERKAEENYQAWLNGLRNAAYVEYRIPVESANGLQLR